MTGKTMQYYVYDTYVVNPKNTICTSQKTNEKNRNNINNLYDRFIKKFYSKSMCFVEFRETFLEVIDELFLFERGKSSFENLYSCKSFI